MKELLRLNWELCVEVLVTTAAAVFLVGVAFAGEWAIVKLGNFFDSEVRWVAFLFKNVLFLFDIMLYGNMLLTLWNSHKAKK